MVSLYIIAAVIAAQDAGAVPAPRPAIKTCPDRSVILATQECAILPDHRYQFTHNFEVQNLTTEWWCRGDRRPSEARIRIGERPYRNASGQSVSGHVFTVELLSLRVKGKTPSTATLRRARQKLAPLNMIGHVAGRCLNKQGGGTQPVLWIEGFKLDGREPHKLEIELE